MLFADNAPACKERADITINTILNTFKKSKKDDSGNALTACFRGSSITKFNIEGQKYGMDYMLNAMKSQSIEVNVLKKQGTEYQTIFGSRVKKEK